MHLHFNSLNAKRVWKVSKTAADALYYEMSGGQLDQKVSDRDIRMRESIL